MIVAVESTSGDVSENSQLFNLVEQSEANTGVSETGRTVIRYEGQELIDRARAQSHSYAAKQDRRKRKHLSEGSFADAANNHGFKRARWRGLWRQQVQDYLIAACQNLRILIGNGFGKRSGAVMQRIDSRVMGLIGRFLVKFWGYRGLGLGPA